MADDYRDLDNPANFSNRSPAEQRLAAIYFLTAGAVSAFNQRIAYARAANPGFVLDLHEADLSNACLWGITLRGANLSGAHLDWADLSGSNLSGADLTDAYMVGADLTNVNLSGATLTGADMRGVRLDGAIYDPAMLEGSIQGDIPDHLLQDNPGYKPPVRKRTESTRLSASDNKPVVTSDGLGSIYAAPKRNYSQPKASSDDDEDDADSERFAEISAEQIQKKKDIAERNQEKFIAKKRQENRLRLKREKEEERFQQKKQQEQEAFERKKREQDAFNERNRKK